MADTKTDLNSLYGNEYQVLDDLIKWGNNIDVDTSYFPYDQAPYSAAPSGGEYTSKTSTIVYTCATWAILLPQLQALLSASIITTTSINGKVDITTNETIAGVKTFSSDPIISGLTADRAMQTSGTKELESSAVTSTELGYVSSLSSNAQDQITAAQDAADNAQSDADDALAALPYCRLNRTADQTSNDDVEWDTEDLDTSNMHDLVTNPERITVPNTGFYQVDFHITISNAEVTGETSTRLKINGAITVITRAYITNGINEARIMSVCLFLTAGDYIVVENARGITGTYYVLGGATQNWITVKQIR